MKLKLIKLSLIAAVGLCTGWMLFFEGRILEVLIGALMFCGGALLAKIEEKWG